MEYIERPYEESPPSFTPFSPLKTSFKMIQKNWPRSSDQTTKQEKGGRKEQEDLKGSDPLCITVLCKSCQEKGLGKEKKSS